MDRFDNLDGMTVSEWTEGEDYDVGFVMAKFGRLWTCIKPHKASRDDYAVDYHGNFVRWVNEYWKPYDI